MRISIVAPCYNESDSLPAFLRELEAVLVEEKEHTFNLIIVDDCSSDNSVSIVRNFQPEAVNIMVYIVKNRINLGHQKSILNGLLFAAETEQDFVIVMDSDGEDDPKAIPLLLKNKEYDIVEVRRGKRKNSLAFKTLHLCYKLFFKLITGRQLNYGNYCMLRNSVVEKIRFTAFIHLPAYLLKLRASRHFITFDRNARISGNSKMNYEGLLTHGFKSLVEFGNVLLYWLLRVFLLVAILLVAVTSNLFYQKFITHTAIPGWFSILFIGLLNLAMICLGFFVLGILLVNQANTRPYEPKSLYQIIKRGNENQVDQS